MHEMFYLRKNLLPVPNNEDIILASDEGSSSNSICIIYTFAIPDVQIIY